MKARGWMKGGGWLEGKERGSHPRSVVRRAWLQGEGELRLLLSGFIWIAAGQPNLEFQYCIILSGELKGYMLSDARSAHDAIKSILYSM